jgi:hypothetical protein
MVHRLPVSGTVAALADGAVEHSLESDARGSLLDLPDRPHDILRLSLVNLGIDLRDERRAMAEDDACSLDAVLLPDLGRGVVPELVGMPGWDSRLLAGASDRPPV